MNNFLECVSNSYGNGSYPPGGSGWYRIAKFDCSMDSNTNAVCGATTNSCEIIMKRAYNNTNNEFHHIRFASVFNVSKFESVMDLSNYTSVTEIRHTVDKTNKIGYIEIYVRSSAKNNWRIEIVNGCDPIGRIWKAIPWEYTEETVNNVSVFSSLTIT